MGDRRREGSHDQHPEELRVAMKNVTQEILSDWTLEQVRAERKRVEGSIESKQKYLAELEAHINSRGEAHAQPR